MPGSSSTIRILTIRPRSSVVRQGQHNGESAARAHFALEADLAAQSFGDLPHHRKADAGAFDSGLLGGVAADKLVKDRALLPRVDPHSLIAHGDRDPMIVHLAIYPHRAAF